ncbi:TOPRIM nucleotidyl transferase/hydrolase domain-containing protein [Motilibacter deserti]|uniref:ATP-dependent endonuclease n=1 Tax=Motilibacter deserti TaxID=2714956 RepID=A0ABX0GTT5_9ACTN|nr:TOPRIM nucleotidyl transferase/hydrolase domain-containing protein [Motilibacter deserti]NHC13064.1 ATP-dependent endonuclease [Motilibacter deserti]
MTPPGTARTVVLVEGVSDAQAVEAAAEGRGLDLSACRTAVVPVGGATNLPRAVEAYGPHGRKLRLAGLCDEREEPWAVQALERGGLGRELDRAGLERLGFFVCVDDLEDELVRALGPDAVQRVIAAQGELGSFRTLQKQAAQRDRPVERQLCRFFGSGSGRKTRYARLLVEALPPDALPRPLARLVDVLDGTAERPA